MFDIAGSKPSTAGDPSAGIRLILACVFSFAAYNAVIKWLSSDYGAFQILFLRGLVGLLLGLAVIVWLGRLRSLRSERPGLQITRGLLGLGSNLLFIIAFRTMPLGDAMAIAYAAPLFVTALSVPLLGEGVGFHRWVAVVVGFIGVLLVVKPGGGMIQSGALYAVLGTLLYALMMIATRRLGGSDDAFCTMIWSLMIYTGASLFVAPFKWQTPDLTDMALFILVGALSGFGMLLFMRAYALAPVSLLAPFDYTGLVWGILLGWLIWSDLPDVITLIGVVTIAASGLYIVHRERIRLGQAWIHPHQSGP